VAQEAPRPGAALFERLFGRPPETAAEEAQLRTLFELLDATLHAKGTDYLNTLAVHLTDLLNVDLCLITRAEVDDPKQMQAVAHARRGKPKPTFFYSTEGTPCEVVLEGAEYHVADGLIEAFPTDKLLEERGYRSYFGVPLWGENEEVIGEICLLDNTPLPNADLARDIIGMFVQRASTELLRIQAREEAKASDEFLKSFFTDFPGWVCGFSSTVESAVEGGDGEVLFSNGRADDLFGPRNYELLRRDLTQFYSLLHPEDRTRVESAYREARHTLGSYDLEYRVRHDDGTYRWVQATGCVRPGVGGRLLGHSVMLNRDDFRRLERRHRKLWQELQTLIQAIPDAVILQDGNGRVRFVNAAVEVLFGLPSAEMVGWDFASLASRHPQYREVFETAHQNTQRAFELGKRIETRARRTLPGTPTARNFETTRIPLFNENGVASGLVTTVRDVTERVAARAREDRIQTLEARAGKLAALSRLVEGVAHEFENQLTAVLGYGELGLAKLRRSPSTPDTVVLERSFDRIREAATMASGISRNLLAFSNASTASTGRCAPATVIRAALPSLTQLLSDPKQLRLDLQAAPEGWKLALSDQEFVDLIRRLLLNSAEACDSGQPIRIEAAPFSPREGETTPRFRLIVQDHGEGIPEHLKERIYDPLFSTREDHSRRRGMGLAIVHNLVLRAGGEMHLQSDVGTGTRFELTFPLTLVSQDQAKSPTHRRRVLVVDDKRSMRSLLRDVLEAGEYEVLTASSCAKAVALDPNLQPDLLLIDVHLQDGLGTELAETLNERWPDLPALFCSGLPADHLEAKGIRLPAGRPLLVKPFRPTELLAAVREALAGSIPSHSYPS
jgi:PAS domain S-box-containing protein